jgi:dTDP-4-dehydrorhamnose 3,5-epimerase-like enzyme
MQGERRRAQTSAHRQRMIGRPRPDRARDAAPPRARAQVSAPPDDDTDVSVLPPTEASPRARGLAACHIIGFPRIQDPRGNLTFVEGGNHVDFDIKRVYYLYDVPGGAERGGHAHRELKQVIIAMSGSFDVVLDDGHVSQRFHLNRSYMGLYIPSMVWRELDNFSSGAVCMVLASEVYDEGDYYRDYDEFRRAVDQG